MAIKQKRKKKKDILYILWCFQNKKIQSEESYNEWNIVKEYQKDSISELDELYNDFFDKIENYSYARVRDRFIRYLIVKEGYTASRLENLKWVDIEDNYKFMPKHIIKDFNTYKRKIKNLGVEDEYVFVSRNGGSINARQMQRIVKLTPKYSL